MSDKPKITPQNMDLFTNPVVEIYQALEEEIFLMVANRLKTNPKHGKDYVLEWQVDKMQQLRMFNQATIKSLSKATGIAEKEIKRIIADVGHGTIAGVDKELNRVYPTLPPPSHIDAILATYVQQTFRELDNFVNQTLITTNYGEGTATRMYRKIVEETTGKVLAGTTTVNKAVAETVIKWSEKGIETSFIDKGGHTWNLENYARTVIRSTTNRTYNELRMSRMQEYGVDLVLVSSIMDAREICSEIQGKVASMSNPSSNPKYPSIYDYGYGTPGGIRGINCRHQFFPFIDGINENNQPQYDLDEVAKKREISQKQRYYERQIRKAKQSLNLAKVVGDEDTILKYKRLVRNRQAKVRKFVAEHGLPRKYDREQIYS